MWYDYDENGSPVGMRVHAQDYLFKKNIQGDIEGLYNSDGDEVVTYTYNSWGKVTEVSGDLADTVGEYNSLRYRGYYYDSDTGLYYLISRYYIDTVGKNTKAIAEYTRNQLQEDLAYE